MKNKLIELIIFIREQQKLDLLDIYIRLEYKRSKKKIIKKLDLDLWIYLYSNLKPSKQDKELSMDRIDRLIFGRSTTQRRRAAFLNLTQAIRQFLVLEELKKDNLLHDWLYWKALKHPDLKEYRKQNNLINEKLTSLNLSKKSVLHQFIAFDFYKEQYNQNCLESSSPKNTDLINAFCALDLIFEQNHVIIQTEFENREHILKEKVNLSTLKYPNDIEYKKLITAIETIPNTIDNVKEVLIPYINFLNDETIELSKKNDMIQFLFNKIYRIYVSGNSEPLKYFWDIYFNFCNENRIFYSGEYFNLRHYTNILSLLSGFDKDKIKDFIDNYESLLSETNKPVGKQFGRIFDAYHSGKFNDIITKLATDDISYGRHSDLKIRYHTFKIRAYFEVYFNEQDENVKKQLLASLKYFSTFLSSKLKLNELRSRNECFVEWIRILLKKATKQELLQYQQEIQKGTVHTKWLNEKIKQKIERMQ